MKFFCPRSRRPRTTTTVTGIVDALETRQLLSASNKLTELVHVSADSQEAAVERESNERREGRENESGEREGNEVENHVSGASDDGGNGGNDDGGSAGTSANDDSGTSDSSGTDDTGSSLATATGSIDDSGADLSAASEVSSSAFENGESDNSHDRDHDGVDDAHDHDNDNDGLNDEYDDNGVELHGMVTGATGTVGAARYTSEVEHGQTIRRLAVQVYGLTAGQSLAVSADGLSLGSMSVDSRGYGRLVLSDLPNVGQSAFPDGFSGILSGSQITIGTEYTGTLTNGDPATGGDDGSSDGSHLRLDLVSNGSIAGRVTFEGSSGGVHEFSVEVWNGVSGDRLSVVVAGVTVGEVVVNPRGFGRLKFETGVAAFPVNWPGISDGTEISVGTELSGTVVGTGRLADASHSEEVEAYDLDHRLQLKTSGAMFENWGGLGEKWLQGSDGWYFITPDGSLYLWDGGTGANGTLIATLDVSFFDNPTALYDAGVPQSGLIADSILTASAASLDLDLGLNTDGRYYDNWGGEGERWVKGNSGWYFITPSGDLYEWDHSSGASGVLVAALDSRFHADPTLLTDAIAGMSPEEAAYALDQGLNFQTAPNDFLNWGGRSEKWLRATDGWYFIVEDGSLYQWNGTAHTASGPLVATLTPAYYADLQLLTAAPAPSGSASADSLLAQVFADFGSLAG
ncbi:MAG: hypothetical protein R3C49_10380 [Planctomycetaceae bacterium]